VAVVAVAHQALQITAAAQLLQAITAALAVPALALLTLLPCAAAAAVTTLLLTVRNVWALMRAGAITATLKRRSKKRIALAHLLRP